MLLTNWHGPFFGMGIHARTLFFNFLEIVVGSPTKNCRVSCHMVDCCCACVTTASEVLLVVSMWATATAQKGHMVVFVREVRAAGSELSFHSSKKSTCLFHSSNFWLLEFLTPRNSLLEILEEWLTPLIDSSKPLPHSSKTKCAVPAPLKVVGDCWKPRD
jgi:hypothetical protein